MSGDERAVLDQADAARVDPDLVWRGVAAVVAIGAAVVGLPSYVVGALVALALGAALERLVRRGRGGADSLLLGVGATLVALVVGGAVLRTTALGTTTTGWGVALGVVSLGCLAVAVNLPRPAAVPRPQWTAPSLVLAAVAAVAVAVIATTALGIGSRPGGTETPVGSGTTSSADGAPRTTGAVPLRMWLGTIEGGRVRVKVSAPERTGPVLLRTTDANDVEIDYPLFAVPARATYSAVVEVPATGRYVISLVDPDRTTPLRSLVVDR